jgi:hypothetical protein
LDTFYNPLLKLLWPRAFEPFPKGKLSSGLEAQMFSNMKASIKKVLAV